MSKKKLEKLKQTDGKVETFQPTTLEQIWGDTGMSRYNTLDEKEYVASLAEMNKSDLQSHAVKLGIVPHEERERLVKKLINEFKSHVASFRVPQEKLSDFKKLTPEVMKILSEGR